MSYKIKYYIYTLLTRLRFTRIINILLLVQSLQLSLVQFTLLQSIFVFSQFAFELPSGILGDLFKKKTIVLWGLGILVISPLIMISTINMPKFSHFAILACAFALEGVGNALLSGADDAIFYEGIRQDGQQDQYGKIRGRVQFIGALALGLATFAGGWLYTINKIFPYILQSLTLLFTLPIVMSLAVKNAEDDVSKQSISDILLVFKDMTKSTNILFIFIFATVTTAMINAIFSVMPDYVAKLGFSSSINGGIFMIYSFIGGIVATQAYRLADLSYKSLSVIVSIMIAVGMMFQVQNNHYIFLVGLAILYVVIDILDPILMQMLHMWVSDKSRATFISGLSFSVSLVTIFLNPIIGFIIQEWGTVSMLMLTGIFTIAMIAISYVCVLGTKK